MEEQVRTIRFTTNARDDRSGMQGYNGEEKTVIYSVAERLVGGGVAIDTEPAALKEKSMDELKESAEALDIDLTGKKGSKAEVAEAIKKGK